MGSGALDVGGLPRTQVASNLGHPRMHARRRMARLKSARGSRRVVERWEIKEPLAALARIGSSRDTARTLFGARLAGTEARLICRYVVTKQHVLVAHVESAVGDDRVRPSGFAGAVGLLEAAPFHKAFAIRLDQDQLAPLGP